MAAAHAAAGGPGAAGARGDAAQLAAVEAEARDAMKLAFIGTHGVGKTTLCYDLVASLKRRGVNADMVKEVARLSPLPINRQTSLDAQIWILMTQVAEEIRSASQHEVVVCDRSVLDNYAYLARACGRQPAVEAFVAYWMRTYDALFKVPIIGRARPTACATWTTRSSRHRRAGRPVCWASTACRIERLNRKASGWVAACLGP